MNIVGAVGPGQSSPALPVGSASKGPIMSEYQFFFNCLADPYGGGAGLTDHSTNQSMPHHVLWNIPYRYPHQHRAILLFCRIKNQAFATPRSPSSTDCCDKCKKSNSCYAWQWGKNTKNVNICWMINAQPADIKWTKNTYYTSGYLAC